MNKHTVTLRASGRAKSNATRHFSSSMKLFNQFRKSASPEGGWTHENFTPEAKAELHQDMTLTRRATLLRAMRNLTASLSELMEGQVRSVVDTALNSFARLYGIPIKSFGEYSKEDFNFTVPNRATMWADAIEQEMARAGQAVTVVVAPAIQSVIDDIYSKTSILLGSNPSQVQLNQLKVLARALAADVTNINATTRSNLQTTIANAIRQGKTVFETAEIVRQRIPQIATNRVPTIVRTEMGNAIDEASKKAMHDSGVVTHFDVIGCEAVEPHIPTYNGVPTCNIMGVPLRDRALVKFHPNHTGTIVPAAFFKDDGGTPNIPLVGGVGIGSPLGGIS